ncbi:hypothetical protein PUN28_007035 [Cardiocondyla obscurior]|uniref:Uncharacterized protein n=1 Tax=Cardiocondyla obscurior TaxID=286306 RepID=A0AAW2G351_9HYME
MTYYHCYSAPFYYRSSFPSSRRSSLNDNTRMRVRTHGGAFNRLSRDMHARVCAACVPARIRRSSYGIQRRKDGRREREKKREARGRDDTRRDEREARRIMRVST